MYRPINVMHLTDTLDSGGIERVAVNIVNLLPRQRYSTYLCTTRWDGALAESIAVHVGRLRLERKKRLDTKALRRLISFINTHDIRILHAHGSALFIAAIASAFRPHPAVVWHDHYGLNDVRPRSAWIYRLLTRNIDGVIAVSQPLVDWARCQLHVKPDNVWYVPNFVCLDESRGTHTSLPGRDGHRIVCVANFRPQKDHLTLLKAMSIVVRSIPQAHLLLVGSPIDLPYYQMVQQAINERGLDQNVSLLGERGDVGAILRSCDIGVLSSASEAFPLVLLEYGLSALPTVATNVGQCAELLNNGVDGILIPPSSPESLAQAMISLLSSPERRETLGNQLHQHVQERYSPRSLIEQICAVYDRVLHSINEGSPRLVSTPEYKQGNP